MCASQIKIAVLRAVFGLTACTLTAGMLTACAETKMVSTMAREKSSAIDAQAAEKIETVETIEAPETEPSKDTADQPVYFDESPRSLCSGYNASGAGAVAYAIVGLFAYSAASWYGSNGMSDNSGGCSY